MLINSNDNKLERTLNFKDTIILAFSTMIGWGWIVLTGSWIVSGGVVGAVVAFMIGAALCAFVGLTYCELTPMLPYAGGELVFSYKAMGYHASWLTGWMITFAYIGVAAWEGPALATAIDYLITIPRHGYLYNIAGFEVYLTWLLIPTVAGAILIFINYRGIKASARFQTVTTIILAIGGIGFALISIFTGNYENIQPVFTDAKGLFTVILAVPAMFVGFDVIPQAAEEMNLPLRRIPKAIIASICLAAGWYIIIIFSAAISAPMEIFKGGGLTVANAVTYATKSPLPGKLIVVTAIMGILTSWNGFLIGATRVLYSMGRARMLPIKLGKLHPKYNTPYWAIAIVGMITIFSPILGKNSLGWFVDASAFGTVIAYFMVALSFIIMRIRYPNIKRPFQVKHGMLIGVFAVIISLFFITLYLPVGSSSLSGVEWIIVLGWIAVGLILYLVSLKTKSIYKAERENAMWGVKKDL